MGSIKTTENKPLVFIVTLSVEFLYRLTKEDRTIQILSGAYLLVT